MARIEDRLPHNAEGEFFVDASCIDCDACRQIAPSVFTRSHQAEKAFVQVQPRTPEQHHRAVMALVACPTDAIGTVKPIDTRAAAESFPEQIEDDVHYCGFCSPDSLGASAYYIRRSAGGVLIDSPRASKRFFRRLYDLGGVRTMFLTHKDDVADHAAFASEFGCKRVIHRGDVGEGTEACENIIEGDEPEILDDDLTAIPIPGHTQGSMALLYKDKYLFTGDHLWWAPGRKSLQASRAVCWYSWKDQIESVRRLLDYRFQWVLPAHGRRYRAPSAEAMRQEILDLLTTLA